MKFIVLTNPSLDNTFLDELIDSNLIPEMVVTASPFFYKNSNLLKYVIKKIILYGAYWFNRAEIQKKYQPYFLARKYSIPTWPTQMLDDESFVKTVRDNEIDYFFVFSYKLITEKVFSAPIKGSINCHPSWLPNNRGATPVNWVIKEGRKMTGITFHFIDKDIDAGAILEQYEIPISGYESAKVLKKYLFGLGISLFVKLIYKLKYQQAHVLKVNEIESGSYQPPFGLEHGIISESNTCEEVERIVLSAFGIDTCARYFWHGKAFDIINCYEYTSNDFYPDYFPFMDQDENFYMKTRDDKIIFLIARHR